MFGSGFFMGAAMLASLHGENVTAKGQLSDLNITIGDPVHVDLSMEFEHATKFSLSPSSAPLPAGLVLDGAFIRGAPTEASTPAIIVVRGRNLISHADSGFEIAVAEPVPAPLLADGSSPAIVGQREVGGTVDVAPGTWLHTDQVTTELLVNSELRSTPYVLQPSDDGATIQARDTATGPSGTATAISALDTVRYAAPFLDGALADASAQMGDPALTRDAGALLTGAGGAWSVTGPGASIDAAGVVAIDTSATISGTITAIYTNSGGTASVSFAVEVAPVVVESQEWTPESLPQTTNFAIFTFRTEDVTVDGSNNVTGITPRYTRGGAPTMTFGVGTGVTAAVQHDAANAALDMGAGVGSVARLVLPFTLSCNTDRSLGMAAAITGFDYVGDSVFAEGAGGSVGSVKGVHWQGAPGAEFTTHTPGDPIIFYGDNDRDRNSAYIALNGVHRTLGVGSASQFTAETDTYVIGARADGTDGINGKIHMVAFFSARLSEGDREKFEGWVKHNIAGMGTVDLEQGEDSGAVFTDHPYDAAEFTEGSPPVSSGNALDMGALYAGVTVEPFRVANLFFYGNSYSVTGLPDGLTMTDGVISGTPSAAGTFASVEITASNAYGTFARTFSLTVSAAPAAVTDEAGLWAAAFGGAPGDTITVDNLGGIVSDPEVRYANALSDTGRSITLVGATDFRVSALPTTNLDAEFRRHVPHHLANGEASTSPAAWPAHPMFTAEAGEYRFGPENPSPYAAPMDHVQIDGGWFPHGLRLFENGTQTDNMGAVAVRHQHLHDGHVLWAMKVRRADGTVETIFEEMDNTYGRNPRPTFREVLREGSPATHLLALATFQIASHASMRVNDVSESHDPRTWALPSRLRRGDLAVDDTAADWDEVSAIIEGLTVTGGQIAGKGAGERFVIQLPPVSLNDTTNVNTRFTAAARTKMQEIADGTDNRIMLVGVPGKTVIPYLYAEDGTDIDIGWVTFTRVRVQEFGLGNYEGGSVNADEGARVRCFGCVIDGLDGTQQTNGATRPRDAVKPSIFEFYDGVITGVTNGPGSGSSSLGSSEATYDALQSRVVVARTIMANGNDDIPAYGSGAFRIEGNYYLGGGGTHTGVRGLLHRDTGAQTDGRGDGKIEIAHYDNIFCTGPHEQSSFVNRQANTFWMLQKSRTDIFDVVGNVFVQPGKRMQFRAGANRRPVDATMTTDQAWFYRANIADNIFISYPTDFTAAYSYPEADITFVSGGAGMHDAVSGANNLMMENGVDNALGFTRMINLLPEEQADADRDAWLDLSGAFASFPVVTGTAATGYAMDFSGTTYAGTTREGYLAPADFAVTGTLQTWGSGGPGVPQHGARLANYLDLPADIYQHLGYVSSGGTAIGGGLYPADWFGGWSPAEHTLDATLVDPWTASVGLDDPADVELKSILFNFRLGATLGSGTLFEETDADGSLHRLEILASGKPRWTVFDTDGTTPLYQMTSARAAEADSHVFAHCSTRFIRWQVEGSNHIAAVQRMIYEHYERDGETDELVHFYHADATEPFSTDPAPIAGVRQVHLWAKTDEANQIYVWNGSAWVWAHGELADIASQRFVKMAVLDEASADGGRELRSAQIADQSLRVIFAPQAPADIATYSPTFEGLSAGDHVWFARNADNDPFGFVTGTWDGAAWAEANILPPNTQVVRGEPHCWFRIDGKAALRETDWIWSNQDPNAGILHTGETAATTSLTFNFPLLDAGDVQIETRQWLVVADAASPSGYRVRQMSGLVTVDPSRYTVDLPTKTVTFATGALTADLDARAEPAGYTADEGTVSTWLDTPGSAQLYALEDGEYVPVDEATVRNIRVRINRALPEERYAAYAIDRELPRGTVTLGADTASPYSETIRFFEARRFRHANADGGHYELEPNGTGIWHRLARPPVNPATGERDHPLLPAADVWQYAASLPLTLNASRTGITAGEGIVLDVAFGAGWPADALRDATVTWNFGDPGATFTSLPAGSKADTDANTATGPYTGHVYETPGSYTVSVTAQDRFGNVGHVTQEITVADPDVVYAGATATVGSDPGDDYSDLPTAWAWATAASGRRLLLRRGDTFHLTAPLARSYASNLYIGAVGTGARPRITMDQATFTPGDPVLMRFDSGSNGVRVGDIEFEGDYDVTDTATYSTENPHHGATLAAINLNGYNVSFGDVTIHNVKASGLGYGAQVGGHAAGGTEVSDVVLSGVEFSDWHLTGAFFSETSGLAIVGSRIAQNPAATVHQVGSATTNNGVNVPRGGPVRLVWGEKIGIQKNHLESWNGSSFAFHDGQNYATHHPSIRLFTGLTGTGQIPDNFLGASMSENHMLGGWNLLQITVQNDVSEAVLPEAVVLEENYLEGTAYSKAGIHTTYGNVTIRNNLIVFPDVAIDPSTIGQASVMLRTGDTGLGSAANLAAEVDAYNNTVFVARSNAGQTLTAVVVNEFWTSVGTIAANWHNNIAHIEPTATWASVDGLSDEGSFSADYVPQAGNPALGDVSVQHPFAVRDFNGNARWPYVSRGALRPVAPPAATDAVAVTVDNDDVTLQVGTVLTVTETHVTAPQAATSLAYQWKRDGVDIGGATSSSFTTTAAGAHTCEVTATLNDGSTVAGESAATTITNTFTPVVAQFRGAVMEVDQVYAGRESNKGTVALRVRVPSLPTTPRAILFAIGPTVGLEVLADGRAAIRGRRNGVDPAVPTQNSIENVWLSILASYHGDGIPGAGGKTFSAYVKYGSDAPFELASGTRLDDWQGTVPMYLLGSTARFNSDTVDFDLQHWVWSTDEPLIPSTNFDRFFEADGTVKDLGENGVITTAEGPTITPRLYMKAEDFVNGTNSGSGGAIDGVFRETINLTVP